MTLTPTGVQYLWRFGAWLHPTPDTDIFNERCRPHCKGSARKSRNCAPTTYPQVAQVAVGRKPPMACEPDFLIHNFSTADSRGKVAPSGLAEIVTIERGRPHTWRPAVAGGAVAVGLRETRSGRRLTRELSRVSGHESRAGRIRLVRVDGGPGAPDSALTRDPQPATRDAQPRSR